MQISKITCIALDGELPDLTYRLVAPDYGMPLIGSILFEAGYDVIVYIEHVKPPVWDRIAESDLVCFSSWNASADKTYRFAKEIRERVGIPIIMGGVHASYFPESSLRYCDYVVFGEGDETILELVERLNQGGDVSQVRGIAYRVGDRVHHTAPRSGPARFDTIPKFSIIEGYRRMRLVDILVKRKKVLLTVQSSRGCPFDCAFCIVKTMFPGGYRTRDIESIILDLRDKRQYGRDIMFVDNEFAGDRLFTKKLLRRIIEEDFGFDMVVFARVGIVKDEELLSLMRQAGISYIFQGYESVQPATLVAYNKHQSLEVMIAAIEKLNFFGFGIWGSFVVGADTDTIETLRSTVDFVLEQKLANAYLWPIWGHYPEPRRGYQTIVPWYRSIFRGWRYCDGHFVTHFPLKMPPSRLQRALIDASRTVYSSKQILKALKEHNLVSAKSKILSRYQWRDIERGAREYIPFLEELEEGLYGADGNLREDLLIERVQKDPQWTLQAGNKTIEAFGQSPLELPIPRDRNITCVPARPAPVEWMN
jgi:anaerobic magnesium-protoporphyrin IX monomethyl ester cyclase